MAQKLIDFVRQLHKSPRHRAAYRKNRDAFVKASKLSPSHKKIILSRDSKAIGHAIVDEHVDSHEPGETIGPLSMPVCCNL